MQPRRSRYASCTACVCLSEDVVVVAANVDVDVDANVVADVLILIIYAYLLHMVKDALWHTRMTSVLIFKQFSRILVNVWLGITDLFFHYDIRRCLYLKHFVERWTPLHKLSVFITFFNWVLKSVVIRYRSTL